MGPIYYGSEAIWNIFDHELPLFGAEDGNNWVMDNDGQRYQPPIPFGFGYDQHRGLDFGTSFSPILSTADGRVTEAGWANVLDHRASFGLHARVQHDNGYSSIYAHLSSLAVQTGDNVVVKPENRSGILGISGNTGFVFGSGGQLCDPLDDPADWACSAHLHFEVRDDNGRVTNPYGWIGPDGADPWEQHAQGAPSHDLWLDDSHKPSITTAQFPSGVAVPEPAPTAALFAVDDGDEGYSESPADCMEDYAGGYGNDNFRAAEVIRDDTATPTCVARWAVEAVPEADTPIGDYEIFVHIPDLRATGAPNLTRGAVYNIGHRLGDGTFRQDEARLVQVVYPNDSHPDPWVYLGRYHFTWDGTEYIELGNATFPDDGAGFVVAADAVRISRVPPSTNVDVALIIDSSGSMTWNDPEDKRLEAATAYLTSALDGDFVGVVDFDGTARLASPPLELPENKVALTDAIYTIDSFGGTNIGRGVQAGCEALIDLASGNNSRGAILLTDGVGDFSGQDQCFSDRDWPIYTFGFGEADEALLQQIAFNTGGRFQHIDDVASLLCEFSQVRGLIADPDRDTIPCSIYDVPPMATVAFLVEVPPGQAQATFTTSWSGSDVVMSLTTPSGRVIDRDTVAPDVKHDLGSSFEVYSIRDPEPGDWEISLFGADVPPEGEQVVFGISTIPAVERADLSLAKTADPNPVILGQDLMYTLTVSNEGPSAATGVVLTDTLPAGVTHISSTPSQGSCTEMDGIVECELGDLASGNSVTVNVVVTPTEPGSAVNSADVAGNEADPNSANNAAIQTTAVHVPIDIKPGSDPNPIQCNSGRGVIPVAILSNDSFDAMDVDHTTVRFEGAGETHVDRKSGMARRHEEDVDRDGDIDLLFHFRLQDTNLTCQSKEGTLTGETFNGLEVVGTDNVRMITPGGGRR